MLTLITWYMPMKVVTFTRIVTYTYMRLSSCTLQNSTQATRAAAVTFPLRRVLPTTPGSLLRFQAIRGLVLPRCSFVHPNSGGTPPRAFSGQHLNSQIPTATAANVSRTADEAAALNAPAPHWPAAGERQLTKLVPFETKYDSAARSLPRTRQPCDLPFQRSLGGRNLETSSGAAGTTSSCIRGGCPAEDGHLLSGCVAYFLVRYSDLVCIH
jgi:hypothetical protein